MAVCLGAFVGVYALILAFHIIAGICLSSVLALAMLFSVAQMRSGRVTLHKLSSVPDGSLLLHNYH